MTQATAQTSVIDMEAMGKRARTASYALAALTTEQKNDALLAIADALETNTESILAANQRDIDAAIENGVDEIWIRDRIDLKRRMASLVRSLASLLCARLGVR